MSFFTMKSEVLKVTIILNFFAQCKKIEFSIATASGKTQVCVCLHVRTEFDAMSFLRDAFTLEFKEVSANIYTQTESKCVSE